MTIIQDKAKVVIIGGGVIGCSVAYHLSKLGWSDVVLLERKQLTSGTTWHAAGLIGQLRASANMTKLAKYTQELYFDLEKETGVSTGFKRVGSISVALTNERMEELKRSAAMARAFGVDVEEISPREIQKKVPSYQSRKGSRRSISRQRRPRRSGKYCSGPCKRCTTARCQNSRKSYCKKSI